MSCNSIYCVNNTGLIGADDVYITGGTYNGRSYWTGQTNSWRIYYYTGTTSYWCLSDTLGGACYLTGKSPCSSTCPDLSSFYVFSGACPTPTPTPTPTRTPTRKQKLQAKLEARHKECTICYSNATLVCSTCNKRYCDNHITHTNQCNLCTPTDPTASHSYQPHEPRQSSSSSTAPASPDITSPPHI